MLVTNDQRILAHQSGSSFHSDDLQGHDVIKYLVLFLYVKKTLLTCYGFNFHHFMCLRGIYIFCYAFCFVLFIIFFCHIGVFIDIGSIFLYKN